MSASEARNDLHVAYYRTASPTESPLGATGFLLTTESLLSFYSLIPSAFQTVLCYSSCVTSLQRRLVQAECFHMKRKTRSSASSALWQRSVTIANSDSNTAYIVT